MASPASEAYVERLFSLCGDMTARKRNRTRVSLYRRVFLNLHWTQCTVNWSVTCCWYCRTAEDSLHRLRFWLLLTYLVLSQSYHINIQNCQNAAKIVTKTKTILKTKKHWAGEEGFVAPSQKSHSHSRPSASIFGPSTRLRNDLYCVELDVKLYYTTSALRFCPPMKNPGHAPEWWRSDDVIIWYSVLNY